jgi:hypothetical protein
MARALVCCALLIGLAAPARAADDRAVLAHARALYNSGDYDGAIAVADDARRVPTQADSADLIVARALLERFRTTAAPDDLAQARDRLRRLSPDLFADRERLEFVVGLGEALFLDDAPGAAAAIFESVLETTTVPLVDGRDLVLDWWATAVDHDARPRTEFERQAMYEHVRVRMRAEIAQHPTSATAAYWAIAAARGQGDYAGAWAAAQAGWVRAVMATDRGAALRGDIDRLVLRAVIPERARATGQSPDTLRSDWEAFKERWSH